MGYPVGYCATVLLLLCEYCYVCENLTVIDACVTDVPNEERLELLKCAILLLPDVHRETLQCLLLFLSDMAKHSEHNQASSQLQLIRS